MGLLGYVLGGALQGAGTGVTNEAIAARQAGIEAMRQKYETQRDETANQRQIERDATQHGYKIDESKQGYEQQAGLLAIGGKIQAGRDAAQHDYKQEEIKTTQKGQHDLALLNAAQDRQTAAYKRSLEAGDIVGEPIRGANGNFYGRKRDGSLVDTGVAFAPSAAADSDTGGGRLSDTEQGTAYSEAHKAWMNGDKTAPEPKRTDFIGMTRADYRSRSGSSSAPPAAKPGASGKRVLSPQAYEKAVSDAMQKGAHGEKGWAGLDAAGIRARLEQIYGAQGYDLPEIK